MKNFSTLSALLLFVGLLKAQTTVTISGVIKDAQNGETLIGATVEAPRYKKGNVSNEYGFYSLSIPVSRDSFEIRFSYIGYQPLRRKVKASSAVRLDVELKPKGTLLNEVEIKASSYTEKVHSTEMSVSTLSAREIKALPTLLGETDIIKILQLKPGISSGSEGSSGLYVRGGNSDQNLIILDEAIVYNANHLFGFFSTFNSDAVKDVKVYKGGFPAQYGGRLSSVIDVRMKEGNNQRFSGSGGVGIVASRLMLEGPIKKGKSSFIISGRRTYVDLITRQINKNNADVREYNPIPNYYFYDLNTKLNFTFSDKDRLYLSGYFGRDVFKYKDKQFNFLFDWGNTTGSARWNHVFGPRLFLNTTATFSNYQYKVQNIFQGFSLRLGSFVKDVNVKADFYYQVNNTHTMRFGANFTKHQFVLGRLKAGSNDGKIRFEAGQTFGGSERCLYISDEWALRRNLKINYGARVSLWQNEPVYFRSFEPRLAANFSINDRWSLKTSYARMVQNVHLLASSGLSLPTDIWYPSTHIVRPEKSDQIALGTSYLFGKNVLLTWEAWYKRLKNSVDLIDGAELYGNPNLEGQLTFGHGFAYSPLELEIEKKEGKLTGWIAYTLSWVKRGGFPDINRGTNFSPRYDTRNNLNIVGIYEINKRWQLTATWVYNSGSVGWLPIGRMTIQDVAGAPIKLVVPVYGDRNNYRMPAYMRGDLSLIFRFKIKRLENDFTLGVYNVTNRRNPYFIYLNAETEGSGADLTVKSIKAKQVTLFPILPSITWNFKF
ncbi:MAG: TonB-dependent receptor [Bacteroidota bacterium]